MTPDPFWTTPRGDFASRRADFLEFSAADTHGPGRAGLFSQISRLELGRGPLDESAIREALAGVEARRDCSDFTVAGLLRICHGNAGHPLLPSEWLDDIRDVLTRFKYWVDEPGRDMMFYWTENHQIMFYSDEYLAGQLVPDAVFPNNGRDGRWHMQKARDRILRWIDLRARIGFSEWDSNCYYDEDMAPLINLVDFAEDPEVAARAGMLLDVMFFDMAVDSFRGVYGTSHGRTYPRHVLAGNGDAMSGVQKIAWGMGAFNSPNAMTAVFLSTSKRYQVPETIEKLAQDMPAELVNLERHGFRLEEAGRCGIRPEDPDTAMPLWGAGMFADRRTAAATLGLADRFGSGCFDTVIRPYVEAVLGTYEALDAAGIAHDGDLDRRTLSEVNKVTYRTPDYQLSCAQDYRKGKPAFQQHIWQATLGPDAVVFTLHRSGEDGGSLKYWMGRLPRAAQYRNLVVAIYDIPDRPSPGPATVRPPTAAGEAAPSPAPSEEELIPRTVAAFPREGFDEVTGRARWVFARKAGGYLALAAQQPVRWTESGIFGAGGLVSDGRRNVWVCQMGREAVDGPFAAWCNRIATAHLTFGDRWVCYLAPGLGEVRFGWEGPLTLDGREIPLRDYPRFDNPYCRSVHGSGNYDIRFGPHRHSLDFGEPSMNPG